MASFDERIEAAVQDQLLPGIVLYARDKSGILKYPPCLI
jgi:hypothetical protein